MTSPPIELRAALPTRPELAAIALFAVAIDAQLTVNIKLFRAAAYRLARLGWLVTLVERSEGGVDRMTPAPRPRAALADPGPLRLANAIDRPEAPVLRLLWGWPEVLAATGIQRRTLEREIAAGRFPKPIRRVGRRPFFRPSDIIRWSEGGRS